MRSRRHKLQVSTFPFLAVLLCAMGALLLVLLVMDRRAHAAALGASRASAPSQPQRSGPGSGNASQRPRSGPQGSPRRAGTAPLRRTRPPGKSGGGDVDAEMQKVRDQMAMAVARLLAERDEETAMKHKVETEHARIAAEEQELIHARRATSEQDRGVGSKAAKLPTKMTSELARLERPGDLKAAREGEEHLIPWCRTTANAVRIAGRSTSSVRPAN